jgi:AcrR family transcriptional regulator
MEDFTESGSAAVSEENSPGAESRSDTRSRTDTRARIQQVAVELFTEHGYEGTSLREIAERLDVTKAALYYHFKSKEDIVASIVEDYYGQIDDLIAWGRIQPKTMQARTEIMRRYIRILADGGKVFRMLQQNQAAVNTLAEKHKHEVFRERMHSLVETLTEPEDSLKEQVGAAMLLGGVSVAWMTFADRVQREELADALCDLAGDMLTCMQAS